MTPKQSLLRRLLAVLSAALLAGVLVALGTWVPVGAIGTHGDGTGTYGDGTGTYGDGTGTYGERGDRDDADALQIVLIKDRRSGLPWPVQDRKFDVVVQVVDDDGEPTEVDEPTKIKLKEVSGPGELGGNTTAVIQKNFSSTTIKGATYSKFANGVVLKVKVVYGEDLAPDKITVEVALTAVGANAEPGEKLKLTDPDCAAPTSKVPTCGILLLKKGADGHVTLSVGSCDGLVKVNDRLRECGERDDVEALVVTAIASLRDSDGDPLYSRKHPAKVILACDKALCPKTDDVTKFKVLFTLNNTGPLKKVAPPCPKEGVIGKDQKACVDYEQSFRRDGDLFLPFLFNVDGRMSCC
jgi:hypothetical protein